MSLKLSENPVSTTAVVDYIRSAEFRERALQNYGEQLIRRPLSTDLPPRQFVNVGGSEGMSLHRLNSRQTPAGNALSKALIHSQLPPQLREIDVQHYITLKKVAALFGDALHLPTGREVDLQLNALALTVDYALQGLDARKQLMAMQVDPKTGLLTHTAATLHLNRMIEANPDGSVAVLMIDADHFKQVNTNWGHPAGDQVLTRLGFIVSTQLRVEVPTPGQLFDGDIAERFGGEEFRVILRGVKSQRDAHTAAERVRSEIANTPIEVVDTRGKSVTLKRTVSIGVSELGPIRELDELTRGADRAIFEAKDEGRNRVCDDDSENPYDPAFLAVIEKKATRFARQVGRFMGWSA
jgi:diguanylate cyclase (GGDEF)-like protein